MPIELRIVTGARAGERVRFDQPVVTIGRQPASDLRFDAQRDLDVSAAHAELRESHGRWTITDRASTNGTFVNDAAISGPTDLRDGDVVSFGKTGPTIEVRSSGVKAAPTASRAPRRPTSERVAVEVRQQTRGIRLLLGAVVVLVAVGAAGAIWMTKRQSAQQQAGYVKLLAQYDSQTTAIRSKVGSEADTQMTRVFDHERDSLQRLVASLGASHSDAEFAQLKKELEARTTEHRQLAAMDLPSISQRNDSAVALIISMFGNQGYSGTAFCVTHSGLLVTNSHLLRDSTGARASSVFIEFANTNRKLPARIVAISDDSTVDLGLVQLLGSGHYPTVAGVSRAGATQTGIAVAALGFPEGYDLPMEGSIVKTTLLNGPVSKMTSSVLQLAMYGAHGSSGTPVFAADGNVIGVVYGGESNSHGLIVYAVPSQKLVGFLEKTAPEILR